MRITIIIFQNCNFAEREIDRLVYKFTGTDISPFEKNGSYLAKPPPTTLKGLKSFLGPVNYISKFIPNLA